MPRTSDQAQSASSIDSFGASAMTGAPATAPTGPTPPESPYEPHAVNSAVDTPPEPARAGPGAAPPMARGALPSDSPDATPTVITGGDEEVHSFHERVTAVDSFGHEASLPSSPPSSLPSSQPASRVGGLGQIGPYSLIKRIGEGGMGIVFLATDSRSKKEVALKRIHAELRDHETYRKEFLREGRAMMKIRHPNIQGVVDLGEDPVSKELYYVSEYRSAGSMKNLIGHALTLPEIVDPAVKIAGALVYAHEELGLIHQDIKPQNILLDERHEPYVADLGIARWMVGDSIPPSRKHKSWTVGTPSYMPPELACNQAPSYQTDIYSFGATLYCLVAGRPPFEGRDPGTILRQIKEGPPPPLRALVPGIDPRLEQIIAGAMARELGERYVKMQYVVDDLVRLRRGEKVLGPHGARSAPAPETRRTQHSAMQWLAGIAAIALVTGVIGGGYWFVHSQPTDASGGALTADPQDPGNVVRVPEVDPSTAVDSGAEATAQKPEQLPTDSSPGHIDSRYAALADAIRLKSAPDVRGALMLFGPGAKDLSLEGRQAAMKLAIEQDNLEIVRIVFDGVQPAVASDTGRGGSFLHLAAEMASGEVAAELIRRQSAVDGRDSGGRTPLMVAAAWGNLAVLNVLVASGAALDATDGIGRTAVHHAAGSERASQSQSLTCIEALLLLGQRAALSSLAALQDHRGDTPIHVAAAAGHERIVAHLRASADDSAQADSIRNDDRLTWRELAAQRGRRGVAELE